MIPVETNTKKHKLRSSRFMAKQDAPRSIADENKLERRSWRKLIRFRVHRGALKVPREKEELLIKLITPLWEKRSCGECVGQERLE